MVIAYMPRGRTREYLKRQTKRNVKRRRGKKKMFPFPQTAFFCFSNFSKTFTRNIFVINIILELCRTWTHLDLLLAHVSYKRDWSRFDEVRCNLDRVRLGLSGPVRNHPWETEIHLCEVGPVGEYINFLLKNHSGDSNVSFTSLHLLIVSF